jgi:TctA family transporter
VQKRPDFAFGLETGGLAATLAFLLAFVLVDFDVGECRHNYIIAFLTVAGTLVAALMTIFSIKNQLQYNYRSRRVGEVMSWRRRARCFRWH